MIGNSNPPLLSIIVVIVSDTTRARRSAAHLKTCLAALTSGNGNPPTEIIVPYLPHVAGIDDLKELYPHVTFIPVENIPVGGSGGSREHHDILRARGLAAARGEIIGLLEDHAVPDRQWSDCLVTAHSTWYADYAAVGGAIENDIDRALNWAVYFCDFSKYQNPVPEGASPFASDANVGYKRTALEAIRPVWQEAFHETAVNWALAERGLKLALSREVVVSQHRTDLRLGDAMKERYVWGRSYAATRSQLLGTPQRWLHAVLTPVLPFLLVTRMALVTLKRKRHIPAFIQALPLSLALTLCWSCGEFVGYVTGRTR